MMTVILCLLPLLSDTQWWSIANLHDPRVTRTSRSSPPDSIGLVSGLDSNNLLQDLMRWSGGVQSGQGIVPASNVFYCRWKPKLMHNHGPFGPFEGASLFAVL